MQISEISDYARQLLTEMGPRAIAHAARKAASADAVGDEAETRKWRRIEEALIALRGPHQS